MQSIWKPTLAFLVIILLLTGGSVVAGKYVFSPLERIISDSQGIDGQKTGSETSRLSDKQYKKIRLAFNSFDLAAGLTKTDFENIPSNNTYYFASLWVCIGAFFIIKKPRKRQRD